MTRINLQDALTLWQQQTPLEDVTHLTWRVLQTLDERSDHDQAFAHLALCPRCRERLWRLQQSTEHGVFDHLRPLAAASGIPELASWTTNDGRYRIELRRLIDRDHRAVLVVRALSAHDLQGRTLVVEDSNGRELLRGTVDSDGLVASEIEDIRSIAFDEFVITEA